MSAQTTLDPSKQLDLYLRVASAGSVTFNFLDENGNAKDISSHTFQAVFADSFGNGIFTLTEGDGLTKSTSTLRMDVSVARATIEAAEYYWRLILTDINKTWPNGKVFFHKGLFDGLNSTSEEITIVEEGDTINIVISDSSGGSSFNYRGAFDASGGSFPSTGGSYTSGAPAALDMWKISVAGTLDGQYVGVNRLLICVANGGGTTWQYWTAL